MKNLSKFITFLGIFLSTASLAQQGIPNFVKSYGGSNSDAPSSIIVLPDSGYVITGTTHSFGPFVSNIYLLRLNKYGDTLWTKVIGNGGESGLSIRLTSGDNLILVNSQSTVLGGNTNIMKLDLNGDIIWSKSYGGGDPDYIVNLNITSDGGYIAIGNSSAAIPPYGDIFVLKIDSNGDKKWGRHYGGAKWEYGSCIVPLLTGGYIATGQTASFNNNPSNPYDAFLLRLTDLGDTMWMKTYSDLPANTYGIKVLSLSDGGFLLCGGLEPYVSSSFYNIFLMRTDSLGNIVWSKKFMKTNGSFLGNVISTKNGGFLIAGGTFSPDTTARDILLIQTDSLGDTLWVKTYGGIASDIANDIIAIDNGFAIVSSSSSFNMNLNPNDVDILLSFVDTNGNAYCFNRPTSNTIVASANFSVKNVSPMLNSYCLQINQNHPITSGGSLTNWCFVNNVSDEHNNRAYMNCYPNPFTGECTISVNTKLTNANLEIYNILGKQFDGIKNIYGQTIRISRNNLTCGIYFVLLRQNNKIISTGKLFINE